MIPLALTIYCDDAPLIAALNSLAKISETSREVVQRFFDGLDTARISSALIAMMFLQPGQVRLGLCFSLPIFSSNFFPQPGQVSVMVCESMSSFTGIPFVIGVV
jgi:hypothetical protein